MKKRSSEGDRIVWVEGTVAPHCVIFTPHMKSWTRSQGIYCTLYIVYQGPQGIYFLIKNKYECTVDQLAERCCMGAGQTLRFRLPGGSAFLREITSWLPS